MTTSVPEKASRVMGPVDYLNRQIFFGKPFFRGEIIPEPARLKKIKPFALSTLLSFLKDQKGNLLIRSKEPGRDGKG